MVGERRQEEQREHGIERQVKSAFVSVTSFLRSQHLAINQPVDRRRAALADHKRDEVKYGWRFTHVSLTIVLSPDLYS